MIKNILLNHRAKAPKNTPNHTTYKDAKTIGILYNLDQFDISLISNLNTLLSQDKKMVTQLGYQNKTEVGKEDELVFSRKDISTIGIIKKERISFFISQAFKFLISLDTSQDINYKFVLAKSKAICKIGLETEAYKELLVMSVKPEASQTDSVSSLVKYLKMI